MKVFAPIALLLASGTLLSSAFAPMPTSSATKFSRSGFTVPAAVRFDPFTNKWEATEEEDYEGAYGPVGSLIRAGPKAFFIHIVSGDKYEQAVLKYMANENCGRMEARGNMDAYFENPNDWAYQKNYERNNPDGYKYDFANANTSPKQLILSAIWAGIVVFFFNDLFQGVISGKYNSPLIK